jgi:putative lipase involved disintegration of autophagic bodies
MSSVIIFVFPLPQDNLLFSCCCARVDFSWSTVCDCYAGGYKCEQTCVEEALVAESVYTAVGLVSVGSVNAAGVSGDGGC